MRVLLVTPSDRRDGFEYINSGRENLGVECLLSSLRRSGHEAVSCNENIAGASIHPIRELDYYDLVGFSLPFWEYRKQYVGKINALAEQTSAHVVLGGHAATLGAKYFLAKCPAIAGVVMGEGEETLGDLADCIEHQRTWSDVLGFMTRESYQPRRVLCPLDRLAFPARDELELSLKTKNTIREAPVETTRGCTYRCSFCSVPQYYKCAHGKRWRERSVQSVCQEIKSLVAEFPRITLLAFTDDNFLGFGPRFHTRAVEVARHIHSTKSDLQFEITCRVDAVEREPFVELAENGLVGVYLGIESGVQRILDSFQKKTTVERNLRAIQILSELGIGCDVGFITFSPGMKLTEVRANLDFLKNIHENYPVFVHPGAVFRCLREYPKDLGVDAIDEEHDVNLSRLDDTTNAMYQALNAVWRTSYENDFLATERIASTEVDEVKNIEKQRAITSNMIEVAFRMLVDAERHSSLSADSLEREFTTVPRPLQLEVG